ncbi:hypothetical protein GT94_12195 [Geobacillus stearothermophilus]|nr:hypothetical protein GT94_12195 [Geobacillus stearothermophilus]
MHKMTMSINIGSYALSEKAHFIKTTTEKCMFFGCIFLIRLLFHQKFIRIKKTGGIFFEKDFDTIFSKYSSINCLFLRNENRGSYRWYKKYE